MALRCRRGSAGHGSTLEYCSHPGTRYLAAEPCLGGAGIKDDAAVLFGSLMDLLRDPSSGVAALVRRSFDLRFAVERSCCAETAAADRDAPLMVLDPAAMVRRSLRRQ